MDVFVERVTDPFLHLRVLVAIRPWDASSRRAIQCTQTSGAKKPLNEDLMMLSLAEFLLLLIIFAAAVLSTIFWIWMLVDCASKEKSDNNNKLIWVITIAVTHVIGAAIYFLVRRPRRRAELGI